VDVEVVVLRAQLVDADEGEHQADKEDGAELVENVVV
jgi:hypothetical protein